MTPVAQTRLDGELVRRGLARSRRRATELVGQGRVLVGDVRAQKASQPVSSSDELRVAGEEVEYVSRAAHKLLGALDRIDALAPGALPVTGRLCLDAGASTGGFTQVLLERGAARVTAVDVGHGQLAAQLRDDPRVVVREGVNVRDLDREDLDHPPGLVVADLSFISLALVLPALVGVCAPAGSLLVMVKPQFEVGRERLGNGGVVRSPEHRTEAVLHVAAVAATTGAEVRAVIPSPLPGATGNREYFLWLTVPGTSLPSSVQARASDDDRNQDGPVSAVIDAAVRTAVLEHLPTLVEVDS